MKLRNSPPFRVFTPGGNIGLRGTPGVGPGGHVGAWHALVGPRQGPLWIPGGSPLMPLLALAMNPQNNDARQFSSNLELI